MLDRLTEYFEQFPAEAFSRGTIILHQDMAPQAAYLVQTGVVKIYTLTAHGDEKLIGFATHNEILPLGWVMRMTKKSQYYYQAYNDCSLRRIVRDEYTTFLQNNSEALYETLECCVNEIMQYQLRVNALGQSKAADKVLNTIHYLALCFGRDLESDVVEIPLPLTQQDIANSVGLTRETTTVELRKLIVLGVIHHREHGYIVNTYKLNHLLDDDYEHGLVRP
jgi:CRP/FNR family cyclic AMP-dependent transcriptional regulator